MTSNQWMSALKLFLPSWNFFNDFAEVPRLEYCLVSSGTVAMDWKPLFADHDSRDLGRVLFNPSGNLELLEASLVERAVDELRDDPHSDRNRFAKSEAHSTLERLTRTRLAHLHSSPGPDRFRFRLVMIEPGAPSRIVFTSEELSLARPGK